MQEFDFARNAFRYIIRKYNIKEIYIPYYICGVMRHAVFAENCKPLFYHIDDNFMPVCSFQQNAYILYPNYFGICDNNVRKLLLKYPKLIIDNAHAYYAEPLGFASFNSAKKFLPVRNGSCLFFGNEKHCTIPDTGRRKLFDNYHRLYGQTNQLNIDISKKSVPFCYPYLAVSNKEADELAGELKRYGKTVYRYWDALPETFNEYKFYRRLVPVPLN